ncbi:MAG: alanine racemase, partial [Microvirga sp.]
MTKLTSQTNAAGGIPENAAGGVLHIDLDALAANWRILRDNAGGAETAAVVKANAYG